MTNINFIFFGTPDRAVIALDTLHASGYTPKVIVTQPDKPQGRKMIITPPPAKVWALAHDVPVLQPEKIDEEFNDQLRIMNYELGVVVAYGKILPKSTLDLPKYGCLNIHGSLLPKYRGPSPIETTILKDDKDTGVSIILMDEKMDHGPILAESKIPIDNWPPTADNLAKVIVKKGAELLVEIIPKWLEGKITPKIQDHTQATFTDKIKKEDGLIDLNGDPYVNFLKYSAYKGWPETFFFAEKNGVNLRVKIKDASYKDGAFIIKRVIPEGKNEMSYNEFMRNQ